MDKYRDAVERLLGALRLPITVYRASQLRFPEGMPLQNAASRILGNDPLSDLPRSGEQYGHLQYIASSFHERYLYFADHEGYEIFIGPLLLDNTPHGIADSLIRSGQIPLNRKNALADHYARLPVLTEKEYFHTGRLAEMLLLSMKHETAPPAREEYRGSPVFSSRTQLDSHFELFEHPPYFLELEMTRLITTGDMENALHALERINTFSRAVLAPDPLRSLKNSLICNCAFYARAAINGGISPNEAFLLSDQYINAIEKTNAMATLLDLEKQSLIDFVKLVHQYNHFRYSAPVREVINYINQHLGERLTVPLLAGQVYLHPNYLSRLFRRETGVPLSSYIQDRRIEESKFLLRYSGNGVCDIADFYHFSSQSHFIKCFRERVGVTPLQYRNSLREQGEGDAN